MILIDYMLEDNGGGGVGVSGDVEVSGGVSGGVWWVRGGLMWLTVVSPLIESFVTRAQGATRSQHNGHLLWQFGTRRG